MKLMLRGIGCTTPSPGVHQARQLVQSLAIEAQHFSDFAGRRTATVGNHIRGHRRAQLPVALVHVLNCFFTLIATRQIEVDVGPLTTLFRKKALEEQLHTHRVNGRDSEGIADSTVGGRPPALNQYSFLAAEANDVPNDQEVARKLQFRD